MKDTALRVSGMIFLLVAILHLVRAMFKIGVVIGGFSVPAWFSIIGSIVPLLLAIWMFKASK